MQGLLSKRKTSYETEENIFKKNFFEKEMRAHSNIINYAHLILLLFYSNMNVSFILLLIALI